MAEKPRIDFYKLNHQNSSRSHRFCCQLAEKVVKMGHSVFIRTRDERQARLLDDMMWTYSDSSFLPHAKQGDGEDPDVPVLTGHQAPASGNFLLINMSDAMPDNLDAYERVAEIIDESPDVLNKGRARYAAYKKNAYALHYHEITD